MKRMSYSKCLMHKGINLNNIWKSQSIVCNPHSPNNSKSNSVLARIEGLRLVITDGLISQQNSFIKWKSCIWYPSVCPLRIFHFIISHFQILFSLSNIVSISKTELRFFKQNFEFKSWIFHTYITCW